MSHVSNHFSHSALSIDPAVVTIALGAVGASVLKDRSSDDAKYAELIKHDPRLDNPSIEVVKSIPWVDLPKQEAINNMAKILNSPLLEAFTRGDFNFLDDIIRAKEIKFQDIAEAHRLLTVKPWAEIIKEQINKFKTTLGLSNGAK